MNHMLKQKDEIVTQLKKMNISTTLCVNEKDKTILIHVNAISLRVLIFKDEISIMSYAGSFDFFKNVEEVKEKIIDRIKSMNT